MSKIRYKLYLYCKMCSKYRGLEQKTGYIQTNKNTIKSLYYLILSITYLYKYIINKPYKALITLLVNALVKPRLGLGVKVST